MFQIIASTDQASGLTVEAVTATVAYSVLGILTLLITIVCVNALFRLNLRKELVEENNVAFGVLIAGLAIAISIIIAGTITS